MEFFIIDGERVPVPPEVVSAGRDAVRDWHVAELIERNVPHTVDSDGNAFESPAPTES